MHTGKIAIGGILVGWWGWFASHLLQINGFLQFILLVVSIGATAAAWRYHSRRTPK